MLKDRLIQFIDSQHLSVRKFETLCGLTIGYVNAMRKGLGDEKLNMVLSTFPQLNREWLLYGEGEMIKNNTHSTQPSLDNELMILKEQVKLLNDIIAQKEKLIQQKDILIEQLLNSKAND